MISIMKALYIVNYKIIWYLLLAVCFASCGNKKKAADGEFANRLSMASSRVKLFGVNVYEKP